MTLPTVEQEKTIDVIAAEQGYSYTLGISIFSLSVVVSFFSLIDSGHYFQPYRYWLLFLALSIVVTIFNLIGGGYSIDFFFHFSFFCNHLLQLPAPTPGYFPAVCL